MSFNIYKGCTKLDNFLGKSVRLYLADGNPKGIRTAEIMNWTGHVIAAPRTKIKTVKDREESSRTGVYLLIGSAENTDLPEVYIGESDEVGKRLSEHLNSQSKEFFTEVIFLTSKDKNLTKAHVRYLEGSLLKKARNAKQCKIMNSTFPKAERLPEADIADMEFFISQFEILLPVLGINFFRKPIQDNNFSEKEQNYFYIKETEKGLEGIAVEKDGDFILKANSKGLLRENSSFSKRLKLLRLQAFETNRAVKKNEHFILLDDIVFTSPSAASQFLYGTSRNGRIDWKHKATNMTYADWIYKES